VNALDGANFAWSLAAVAATALLLRLTYLWELSETDLFGVLVGDAGYYDAWGRRIAAGDWFGESVFYQSPLYPYLLVLLFSVAGHSLTAVRLVQAGLSIFSCILLGLAGRRFFGPRVGLVSALLLAIYPWAIFSDGLIQKSAVELFLMTSILASVGVFLVHAHWKWLVAAGLALGVFTLSREAGRALYPVLAVWLLAHARTETPFRTRAGWVAIFTASAAAVMIPVAVRNYVVSGEFVLSTANLGPNLYIGNHEGATGVYDPLVRGAGSPDREHKDATELAEKATGRELSSMEVSNYWRDRSIEYVRTDPLGWIRLIGRKALLTVNAGQISDSESLAAYSERSKVLRGLAWFDFGIVLPLAGLGAWEYRRAWKRLAVMYASFAALGFSLLAFFVFERYRYPMMPIALLFAGAGLVALPPLWRGPARQLALPLLLVSGLVLISHVPVASRYADTTFFNLGVEVLRAGRPRDAVPLLRTAIERYPDDAAAYYNLGVALDALGEKQAAIAAFEASVRLEPDNWQSRGALALTLKETGNIAGALLHFREAARLKPNDPAALTNLGAALTESGLLEESLTAFQESIRFRPDDVPTQMNVAALMLRLSRPSEAVRHAQRAAALAPTSVEARYLLGQAYALAGMARKALAEFEAALTIARGEGVQAAIPAIEQAIQICRDALPAGDVEAPAGRPK